MAGIRKNLNIAGADLWYLVGLITTDGSLSKDGRHIDITSKDGKFLKGLVKRLALSCRVTIKGDGFGRQAYRIQIANRNFYDFLLSIGLMPKKSLILKKLDIPEIYFVDFLRGVIDGDGYMSRWLHTLNKNEQWILRICSGSNFFIHWLKKRIESLLNAKGRIYQELPTRHILKYGKMAAREILERCYYQGCFGLKRKMVLAQSCVDSYRGWSKSKTVF